MVRAIKVGDKVRILTKGLQILEEDSRKKLYPYQVVTVDALDNTGLTKHISVKTARGMRVLVPSDGIELFRSTDVGLGDVLDLITDKTLQEGNTVEVNGEIFKVYKDSDGLGLKQETSTNDSEDLLNIPSRYVNRSYILPLRDEKIQLSLEDLKLRFGSDIEIID